MAHSVGANCFVGSFNEHWVHPRTCLCSCKTTPSSSGVPHAFGSAAQRFSETNASHNERTQNNYDIFYVFLDPGLLGIKVILVPYLFIYEDVIIVYLGKEKLFSPDCANAVGEETSVTLSYTMEDSLGFLKSDSH